MKRYALVVDEDIRFCVVHKTRIGWVEMPEGFHDVASMVSRIRELEDRLNTPELHDFAKAVALEAAHQRERWRTEHDAGTEKLTALVTAAGDIQ